MANIPTQDLKAIIRAALSSHHVTIDQLLALLNTDADVRAIKLSKARLADILRRMVVAGDVEKTVEPTAALARFRLPVDRYRAEVDESSKDPLTGGTNWRHPRWQVVRLGNRPGIGLGPERLECVIGKDMTEAEARCAMAALNALDRKVRGMKAG